MVEENWIYKSGDIWLPDQWVHFLDSYIVGNETSIFYINYWHINHFLSGIFFGIFAVYFSLQHPILLYIAYHTLWELWQIYIGMTPRNVRGGLDILNDTLVGTLGCFLVTIWQKV